MSLEMDYTGNLIDEELSLGASSYLLPMSFQGPSSPPYGPHAPFPEVLSADFSAQFLAHANFAHGDPITPENSPFLDPAPMPPDAWFDSYQYLLPGSLPCDDDLFQGNPDLASFSEHAGFPPFPSDMELLDLPLDFQLSLDETFSPDVSMDPPFFDAGKITGDPWPYLFTADDLPDLPEPPTFGWDCQTGGVSVSEQSQENASLGHAISPTLAQIPELSEDDAEDQQLLELGEVKTVNVAAWRFKCGIGKCSSKFHKIAHLRRHWAVMHSSPPETEEPPSNLPNQPHQCPCCEIAITRLSDFRAHLAAHAAADGTSRRKVAYHPDAAQALLDTRKRSRKIVRTSETYRSVFHFGPITVHG